MTPDDRAKLRELLAKATYGPWEACGANIGVAGTKWRVGWPPEPGTISSLDDGEYVENTNGEHDAALIAAVVNALPALLDDPGHEAGLADGRREGKALKAENAKLRAALKPMLFWDDADSEIGYCDPWEIVEKHGRNEAVLVREGVEIDTRWYVDCGLGDDDEDRRGVFNTRAEADAFIALAKEPRS